MLLKWSDLMSATSNLSSSATLYLPTTGCRLCCLLETICSKLALLNKPEKKSEINKEHAPILIGLCSSNLILFYGLMSETASNGLWLPCTSKEHPLPQTKGFLQVLWRWPFYSEAIYQKCSLCGFWQSKHLHINNFKTWYTECCQLHPRLVCLTALSLRPSS